MDEDRRKKLKIRAWRRGIREMDLVLGPFADAHLEGMTTAELEAFEALLEVPDLKLLDWVLGRIPPEAPHDGPLFARVAAFAQDSAAPGARGGGA